MITTIRDGYWIRIFEAEAINFNLRERIFRLGYEGTVHFTSFFLTYKNHDKDSKEGLLG